MRRPKPTALKLLNGNPGHRKLRPDINITQDLGECPHWFDKEQGATWDHIKDACPVGMLKETDRATMTAFCEHAVAHARACQALKGQPLVVKQASGRIAANPLLSIKQAESYAVRLYATELGFTPAARTRVHVDASADANEFDSLLPARRAG